MGDKGAGGGPVASGIRAKRQLGDFSFEGTQRGPTFREYSDRQCAEACIERYSRTSHKEPTREDYRGYWINTFLKGLGIGLEAAEKVDGGGPWSRTRKNGVAIRSLATWVGRLLGIMLLTCQPRLKAEMKEPNVVFFLRSAA